MTITDANAMPDIYPSCFSVQESDAMTGNDWTFQLMVAVEMLWTIGGKAKVKAEVYGMN